MSFTIPSLMHQKVQDIFGVALECNTGAQTRTKQDLMDKVERGYK